MSNEKIVVMSGAPGTGKFTLGAFLADSLGFPFLAFDAIHDALADRLSTGGLERTT